MVVLLIRPALPLSTGSRLIPYAAVGLGQVIMMSNDGSEASQEGTAVGTAKPIESTQLNEVGTACLLCGEARLELEDLVEGLPVADPLVVGCLVDERDEY